MDPTTFDPYEQQLYVVFNNYDINQTGTIDRDGLSQLCCTLQLEERGSDLIHCLLNSRNKKNVTFYEFKEALLSILGDGQITDSDTPKDLSNKSISDDDESPDREVSPKYIYGAKKYGRRSRPRIENELDDTKNESKSDIKVNKIQRSSSHSDVHPLKKRKGNTQLKRCTSFPDSGTYSNNWQQNDEVCIFSPITGSPSEQREIDREMARELWKRLNVGRNGKLTMGELKTVIDYIGTDKISDSIINKLHSKINQSDDKYLSFNSFLELFRASDMACRTETNNDRMIIEPDFQKHNFAQFITLGPDGSGVINSDVIVDIWENAGITSAHNLLCDLGFTKNQINIADLAMVIDDELRNINGSVNESIIFPNNPHISLLQASLALYQSEVRCLKSAMEHLNAERDKLKSDINDANQRASLLAQEVDDNHAKMEKATKEQVRHLEQRHADIVKDLTEQLTGEREQATLLSHKLEKRVASLEAEEMRLKMELSTVQEDVSILEKENQSLLEQVSELEQSNSQLLLSVTTLEGEKQKICDMEGNREREQMLSYLEKISNLQFENTALKDKNDELCIELESINSQLSALRLKKANPPNSLELENSLAVGNSSGNAIKRRGEISCHNTSTETNNYEEESPRISKLRKCHKNETGLDVDYDYADSSISITSSDGGFEDDVSRLQARVAYLENLLANYGHDVSSDPMLTKLVKDSENPTEKQKIDSLKDRCKQLEIVLHDIKMGLQTAISEENCNEKCDIKDCVTEIQQKLIENVEFIKKLSQENDVERTSSSTPPVSATSDGMERLLAENKALEQRCSDLEVSLDLLRNEYERCEDYWANKLDEERQLFDQEQKQSNLNFQELLNKMSEFEEQLSTQDNKLPVIEENTLERQFTELEEEFDSYRETAEKQLTEQQMEIEQLKLIVSKLEMKKETMDAETQSCVEVVEKDVNTDPETMSNTFTWTKLPSYSQSNSLETNPNDNVFTAGTNSPPQAHVHRTRKHSANSSDKAYRKDEIKRLRNIKVQLDEECLNLHKQKESLMKEVVELQNKAKEIDEPVITFKWKGMRGFTNLNSKINNCGTNIHKQICRVSIGNLQELNGLLHQLDQKCRHLQQVLRRQQQQAESMLHQSWVQHKGEITDLQYLLKTTQEKLERQSHIANDQSEQLARTDMLVKDLYIENSYLLATVQRLEHHCLVLSQCNMNNSSSV
ncbi:ninein-like protein [Chrysoperla carnea]|uniref:ninein-like protein n=1 Tax=Chrysoperla carnea TaxID=189513 RepID=UPI001D086632|nr:ninein-like protein [Chrysoperla carnea]